MADEKTPTEAPEQAKAAEATAIEAPANAKPKRSLNVKAALLWTGSLLLVAFTLYVGVMTTLWGIHMAGLRSEADQLESELAIAADAAAADASTAEALGDDLDDAQGEYLLTANRIVKSDDYQILYEYVGDAMIYCIDWKWDLVGYVEDKNRYITSSLRAYERQANSYCGEIHKAIKREFGFEEESFAIPSAEPATESEEDAA